MRWLLMLVWGWVSCEPTVACAAAEWIWYPGPREVAEQSVYLRQAFSVPGQVTATRLRVAAEFAQATVWINGRQVASIEDFSPQLERSLDVGWKPGANVVGVRGASHAGPSAIVCQLELTMADGQKLMVETNEHWRATQTEVEGWATVASDPAHDWQAVARYGTADAVRFGNDIQLAPISAIDDYAQWKQALGTGAAADPARFSTLEGFEIELVRAATAAEGSWVSLAFDPRGRIVIAREERGLLRLTLDARGGTTDVATIDDSLLECRGLVFLGQDLFANANNSLGLFRLSDRDGDDRFESQQQIYASTGGVGHGRNDLALDAEQRLYSIHGDSVDLPTQTRDWTSPFRSQAIGQRGGEGHVVRFDLRTGERELLVAGLRNPYGIAINADGEMFTYDADAEFDMGAPWYRPTRVSHLLVGGDYGWRAVTGKWPPYYCDRPDATPPNLEIGKGSPTAVQFGYGSHFPAKYQQALFVLDWTYGRVIAVHLEPWGASYAMRAETFLRGRPLNVTDIAMGPDGAMYLLTGGRKTQSGLYRVRFTAPSFGTELSREPELPATAQQQARRAHAVAARQQRRRLESLMRPNSPDAISIAWPELNSPDPWLRHAARLVIEHQPVELWATLALEEPRTTAALEAGLALARSGRGEFRPQLLTRLNQLPWSDLTNSQRLVMLRTYELCLQPATPPDAPWAAAALARLLQLYPDNVASVNHDLSRILSDHDVAGLITPTLQLHARSTSPMERMHYRYVLSRLQQGWTTESRHDFFVALQANRDLTGGEGMPGFVQQIQAAALAATPEIERAELAAQLQADPQSVLDPAATDAVLPDRPFVKQWQLNDLVADLGDTSVERDVERGRQVFSAALCSRCHRIAGTGPSVGPDLTAVSNRFSRRDLLDSILAPSKVVAESYQNVVLTMKSGQVVVGHVATAGDYRSDDLRVIPDLLQPAQSVTVPKADIEAHDISLTSPMPQGLLDRFTRDEIFDLLAYIDAQQIGDSGLGPASRPAESSGLPGTR